MIPKLHRDGNQKSSNLNLNNPISFRSEIPKSNFRESSRSWNGKMIRSLFTITCTQTFRPSLSVSLYHDFHKFLSNKTVSFTRCNIYLSANILPSKFQTPQIGSGRKNHQQNKKFPFGRKIVLWSGRKMREKLPCRGIDTRKQQDPTDSAIYPRQECQTRFCCLN